MSEQLGPRIALLRSRHGFTQQELADRLAISRTAVSHLEAGISIPSERTVTLLAGLFKIEPVEMIAGTQYPEPKAERLPLVTCRYTEAELQAQLIQRDCAWLQRLHQHPAWQQLVVEICKPWFDQLDSALWDDRRDQMMIAAARAELEALWHAAMRDVAS